MSRITDAQGVIKRWSAEKRKRDAAAKAARAAQSRAGRVLKRWRKRLADAQRAVVPPSVMYDSVTVSAIPKDAKAVAGYVGGRFLTFPTLIKQFPDARKVSIAVASTQDAHVLDIEPGNSRADLAPGWYRRQVARGMKRPPVLYCAVSSAREVVAAMTAAGIPRSKYRLWTAHYTFKPHICSPACGFGMPTTADATQWTDKSLGRNLDESLVRTSFWK